LRVSGITVKGVGSRPAVDQVSFEIRSGEVLGIAGVEGNGQFELCQAILGLEHHTDGTVELNGVDITRAHVQQRLESGLSYIPFDRHREGLLLSSPLWENTLLGRDGDPQFTKGPFVNSEAVKNDARQVIADFDVRTPSELVPAFALSGGNQQKLLVGRELASRPSVLIAAHPTRGVDIGAQAAIWDKMRVARDAGLAVLLISADLEELIGLSDRILVMFDGQMTARLTPAEATPELLGSYMTGAKQEAA
ncbi:MAG: ATP-binding cassette domain-containing protein, partial [Actinomycetota bacterium]|nr:ATP-binding cassette domain-containing protein [Actinomycetota bacterium]